jgi:hypothetical protein
MILPAFFLRRRKSMIVLISVVILAFYIKIFHLSREREVYLLNLILTTTIKTIERSLF